MSDTPQNPAEPESAMEGGTTQDPRSSRFRFKSRSKDDRRGVSDSEGRKRRRHHHASHGNRKRQRSSQISNDEPRPQDHISSYLPPDQAFRESLFDAMGDDEGAAFWENVYGQPIHNYPNTYQDEETGELERMNDEEYAQFVRRKMWEKSWEGVETAREEKRREREREKQKMRDEENRRDADERARREGDIFNGEIEASLRRGERRRDRRRWQSLWKDYLRRWEELQSLAQDRQQRDGDPEQVFLRNKIAWPVESGTRADVCKEQIERFVRKGLVDEEASNTIDTFVNAVKVERVRWHPDKMQQRYGFMEIDNNTLQGVTATFQVFDAIWNELRDNAAENT